MRRLIAKLPPSLMRAVGRLQFRHPILRRVIGRVSSRLATGESVISHGVGKGLKFDARGGYLGYALGMSEPAEQNMLAHLLSPGDTFYDLGANVGFFSTIAARLVGPEGSVYAFEPHPESAQRARDNAERNGFANVSVVEAAVGRKPGVMRLDTAAGDSAAYRLTEQPPSAGVDVAMVSIDGWRAVSPITVSSPVPITRIPQVAEA